MKSAWYTSRNNVGGESLFIAMRDKDINQIRHSGNVETYGSYETDRAKVEAIVRKLNSGEIIPEGEE